MIEHVNEVIDLLHLKDTIDLLNTVNDIDDLENLKDVIDAQDVVDPFLDTESLQINDEINVIESRVDGMERADCGHEISFGKGICASRHGCTGALNCENAYADYHG